MKKSAFTLIELLVSVVLLALIFNYLYNVIHSLQKRNKPYIKQIEKLSQNTKLYTLFSDDISNAVGGISIVQNRKFDTVIFQTYHSLYHLKKPFVYYFVSKQNNALLRIEAQKYFDIFKESNPFNVLYFGDILATETQSFKVTKKEHLLTLLFRSKSSNSIAMTLPTGGK